MIKRNTKLLLIILVFIFSISFSGCLDDSNQNKTSAYMKYSLTIEVNNAGNYSYIIIIPVPIISKDLWKGIDKSNISVSTVIIDNLQIKNGLVSYSLEENIHGYGLMINATGNIFLESKGEGEYYTIFSMQNDTDGNGKYSGEGNDLDYWIYYKSSINTSSVSINIYGHFEENIGAYHKSETKINGFVKNGWQIIKGMEISLDE